jgi:hypothetical protein
MESEKKKKNNLNHHEQNVDQTQHSHKSENANAPIKYHTKLRKIYYVANN